jgi:hypothetical protein
LHQRYLLYFIHIFITHTTLTTNISISLHTLHAHPIILPDGKEGFGYCPQKHVTMSVSVCTV